MKLETEYMRTVYSKMQQQSYFERTDTKIFCCSFYKTRILYVSILRKQSQLRHFATNDSSALCRKCCGLATPRCCSRNFRNWRRAGRSVEKRHLAVWKRRPFCPEFAEGWNENLDPDRWSSSYGWILETIFWEMESRSRGSTRRSRSCSFVSLLVFRLLVKNSTRQRINLLANQIFDERFRAFIKSPGRIGEDREHAFSSKPTRYDRE